VPDLARGPTREPGAGHRHQGGLRVLLGLGHFIHSPFYVYAYAFGDCLVNSLYAVYEKVHDGFAERYLAMLAAGGTKHHAELLKPFGLDVHDPAFWQGGLSVIEGMIAELERLG
jgi:oligoendopeptidase F